MAETLKQVEAVPASWPAVPDGLSDGAAAVDPAAIWTRLEGWCAHRWSAREVVWTVQAGAGDAWAPPLAPVASLTGERWAGEAWAPSTGILRGPMGFHIPANGTWRLTGQVGEGPPPAAALEAYRRFAEYLAGARELTDEPGASSSRASLGGSLEFEIDRNPAWKAKALAWSGAADLLRPYRRA